MQVNSVKQNYTSVNFQAAYKVQRAVINGVEKGQQYKKELYNVAKALSDGMYHDTLSATVKNKVMELFKDYAKHPFMIAARNPVPKQDKYKQKIALLSANDAQIFHNICQAKESYEIIDWNFNRILEMNKNKRIRIYANENNGNYEITDIELFKSK